MEGMGLPGPMVRRSGAAVNRLVDGMLAYEGRFLEPDMERFFRCAPQFTLKPETRNLKP